MHPSFSLEGKTILVTGASSGIGRQTALDCASSGAAVVLSGRDAERLDAGLAEARSRNPGAEHRAIRADFSEESQVEGLAAECPPLDGVAHVAGYTAFCPSKMLKFGFLEKMQRVNVNAAVVLTARLLRGKKLRDGGSLVFVASTAPMVGVAGNAAYAGTKAALIAHSRYFALELAPRQIRSNCVSPAMVRTPLFDQAYAAAPPETVAEQEKAHPLGFGEPEDVAHACIYLLSPASRWITGQQFVLDGGLTLT